MQTQWQSELVVDTSSRKERMDIQFDISFPKIPCFGTNLIKLSALPFLPPIPLVVTLDIMDAAQEYQTNIEKSVKKHRLDTEGNIIQGWCLN
jgi:hypothetical protein